MAPGVVSITASADGKTGATAVTVIQQGAAPVGDYTGISSNLWYTCASTVPGVARCWGMNGEGQLGDGTSTERESPVQVSTAQDFVQVVTGSSHACGRTAGGDIYCWGDLGIWPGNSDIERTPKLTASGLAFTDFSIGDSEQCGRSPGGDAYCWGVNQNGGVGDGTRTLRTTPTLVSGGLTFAQVTAGGDFACGRVSSGAAYCWGHNNLGQLGDSTTTDRLVPTPVSGGLSFIALSAAQTYTCGLVTGGKIYCWGTMFAVVPGTGGKSLVPTQVVSGFQFTQVSAGTFHACALTATGAAYCWGDNVNRELGDGSLASDRMTPVAVTGGLAFSRITAGYWATCGVTTQGAAFCWGRNDYGGLGIGTTAGATVPTQVK